MRCMRSSRSDTRSLSTSSIDVSMGRRRSVASLITPVSPMPPAVPQNRSGSCSGPTTNVPFGAWSVNDSTWLAKLPSTWWPLPWMSAAIAPPTVTKRVPGDTTKKPNGTSRRISASRLTPASTRITPRARSKSRIDASVVASTTVPPAFCAASPYERPSPRATSPRRPACSSSASMPSISSGVDDARRGGRGAPPPGQQPVRAVLVLRHSRRWRTWRSRAGRAPG